MAGPAATLKEIHRLRRNAKDLQTEIERLPQRLKAQQSRVARQEELRSAAQESLKKTKVSIHEKESELKSTHQNLAKHKKQLDEAVGQKEFDALQAEIARDQKTWQRLEDEILAGMADVDDRTAKLPELDKGVEQARLECAQFETESQTREASLRSQLAEAVNSLKEVEKTLPDDIRQQFDRLAGARSEDALASVSGRTCTACYTEITAQNYNELLQGRFLVCKSCGRMLYLAE